MKKISTFFILCLIGTVAQAGPLGLVDDFEDTDLSEYTLTVVLDQDTTRSLSFQSPSGAAQVTGAAGVEQALFLRDDYSIAVGEVLLVDLSEISGLRNDIGIAVCFSETPPGVPDGATGDTRQDYAAVYVQADNDNLKGIFVDGTSPGSTIYAGGSHASTDVTHLYIRRDSATDWALGYISGVEGWYDFATGSLANTDIGNAIGFFGDIRNVDTAGDLDNLSIVPEPATMVLLGIGSILALRRRK